MGADVQPSLQRSFHLHVSLASQELLVHRKMCLENTEQFRPALKAIIK